MAPYVCEHPNFTFTFVTPGPLPFCANRDNEGVGCWVTGDRMVKPLIIL